VLVLQANAAALTSKAGHMKELIHCPQAIVSSVDFVVAFHTHAEEIRVTAGVQIFHE